MITKEQLKSNTDLGKVQNDLTRALFSAGFKQVNYHEDEFIEAFGRGYQIRITFKKKAK